MRDGFVLHGAEGALGGAIGALLIEQSLTFAGCLPARPEPWAALRDPGEIVVARLEARRGRPLPDRTRVLVIEGVRWLYGAAWGGLLGLSVSALRVKTVRRTLAVGAAVGALAWLVENAGALARERPLALLGRGRAAAGPSPAASLLLHVLAGVVASAPIALVDHRSRRQPWWRRVAEALRPRSRIRGR